MPPPDTDLVAFQTDLYGNVFVGQTVEGQQDDGGPLLQSDSDGGGVAEAAQNGLLSFGNGDFGSFTWQD